ncbi:MAG: DUF2206 domain-containing protein [Candidatus Bathyarchaeia archaeon]
MSDKEYSAAFKAVLILAPPLPVLSVLAAYSESSQLLLLVYFLIAVTVLAVLREKNTAADSDLIFLVLIWCVSLSLLLSSALISGNLRGYDIHDEYRISSDVVALHSWNVAGNSLYNSVISITLFVPLLSIFSGLDTLVIHQLVLPLVYSIAPVVLYKIYRRIVSPRTAFASSLLFMSFPTFSDEMVQLGRQEVGEVLLLLLILLLLSRRKGYASSGIATVLLTLGFITAHYALVFIFLFFLAFSIVLPRIMPQRAAALADWLSLLIILVGVFSWYVFVAGGVAISTLGQAVGKVSGGLLVDFFSPSSRPTQVLLAAGVVSGLTGALHELNRIIQYVVPGCIVLGFVSFARKPHKTFAELQMFPLMAAALVFIAAAVILPFFAGALEFSRVYHIALIFISPCFVFGVGVFDSAVNRLITIVRGKGSSQARQHLPATHVRHISVKWVIVVIILFSYFLLTSGWVWAVTMDQPSSLVLDGPRMQNSNNQLLAAQYYQSYTQTPDVAAARWLRVYRMIGPVCSDEFVRYGALTSYGDFPRTGAGLVDTLPYGCKIPVSYVYLSEYNNVAMIGHASRRPPTFDQFSIADLSSKLMPKNRLYSDGAAIYL